MPKVLEELLKREANKKGLSGKRFGAYVYGTMQKTTNWKPGINNDGKKNIIKTSRYHGN